ncbi:MAG: Hsp70 family protein [Lachnospiraceae bacterium]|nr:Hsp70 family protein [Lachnospiraceae bacterium]
MVLGIDLGTTYSAAAYIDDDGNPQIIVNSEGERITPSVFYQESKDNIIIGEVAKENAVLHPKDVVAVVKNDMGKATKYEMSTGDSYVPEQISGFIIKKMVQDAESYAGCKFDNVVITVPAYFNNAQRVATEDAAKIAGVNMIGSINEPTAALLCYIRKKKLEHGNVMVYDLGGGTFDVSIVRVDGDNIEVLSNDGIAKAGGHFFDVFIVDYVCEYLREHHNLDLEAPEYIEELQDIYNRAEKCKIQLSAKESVNIPIKIGDVKDSIEITREFFEGKLKRFYRSTEVRMNKALQNAGITVDDLETVLLVGGSSRIPYIEENVRAFTGKAPAKDINPDEAVAIGAAIFGSYKTEDNTKKAFTDANSHGIGFLYFAGRSERKNQILIQKNSLLPVKATQKVKTIAKGQEKITLTVTEGELEDPKMVKELCELDIKLPQAVSEGTEVNITFELDEYQILHVFVDIPSVEGWKYQYEVPRENKLTAEDIAMMTGITLEYKVS